MTRATVDEFKLLTEAADALVACDERERIVHLNPSAEGLLGWRREELTGRPFNFLVPERLHTFERSSLLHYLLSLPAIQEGHPALLPLKRRGGEELMLEVTVGTAGVGEHERIAVSLRRIPETPDLLRGSLNAHRPEAAERLYRLIVDNAPLGIFHFDSTPVITACNDYFVRIVGSSRRLLVGLNLLTLQDERVMCCIRATLRGEHTHYEGDYASVTARKVTPVRARFAPCFDENGEVSGGVGIVEDVTDRKQAEQEHSRLFREAQEAIRVREDFLTIVSHELKTPLTPLSLRLANLERRLERGEPVDPSALRHARQHLVRLTALINDLLDASRIEAGGLALHPQPTRLDVLIEHVIHLTEGTRGPEHRIDFHHPQASFQVLGDPYRLEQVISNLLENALKYSPGGGTIHVALETRGAVALVTVRDPGIGIPADQQQHLFERYFRARNASTHSYGGLGLGLYICRDIVERHGGRIWVESELGRGSTFYVALPTLEAARATTPHPPDRHVH